MNIQPAFRQRVRRLRLGALLAFAALVATIVCWKPLLWWFTGEVAAAPPHGQGVVQRAGPFQVTARIQPDPPAQRGNTLWLQVADGSGRPVSGAHVSVEYRMPAMGGMPEMKGSAEVAREGQSSFRAQYDLPMAGGWTLHADIDKGSARASLDYAITVGSAGLLAKSAAGSGELGAASQPPSAAMNGMQHTPAAAAGSPETTQSASLEQSNAAAVSVDAAQRAELDLRSEPVREQPLRIVTHALGQVKVDETRQFDVTLLTRGWIRELRVNATGQSVAKGQLMFTLYSPEIFAAEQEFLAARRTRTPGVSGELIAAARDKLRLWGLPPALIDQIAQSGKPIEDVPFRAPGSGYVLDKNVVEGAEVQAGQRLYRIAPLDRVWVDAQLYEQDLPYAKLGQTAQVTLPFVPGRTFEGKVSYIYPTLQGSTRTGTVRIELVNRELLLKPDMYADVLLQRDLGSRLQVPAAAVLYTGPRRIVFVDRDGVLVPRDVRLGARAGDSYEVLSGLSAGERVLTQGNFLIAAESRLKSATGFWAEPQP